MDSHGEVSVTPLRQVVRVVQSPMNTQQWCLELECGHDKWITRKRKPRISVSGCERCRDALEVWTEGPSEVTCKECQKCLKKIPMPTSTRQLNKDQLVFLLKLLQTSADAVFDDQGEYAYMRGEGINALHQAIEMLEIEDDE